jgi:hypothetical protein
MTNMAYRLSVTISSVGMVMTLILVMNIQLVQCPCDMIYSSSVTVLVCINPISSSMYSFIIGSSSSESSKFLHQQSLAECPCILQI